MKTSIKTASTLSFAGVVLAFFTASVTAQPPGSMGQGAGMGMGGGGMMMNHMKAMDEDGDGKISQQEWNAFHEQRFSQMDTSGDGYLDTQEFSEGVGAMQRGMQGGMMPPMQPGGVPGQPQGQPAQQ
jgi:EF hand